MRRCKYADPNDDQCLCAYTKAYCSDPNRTYKECAAAQPIMFKGLPEMCPSDMKDFELWRKDR